MSAYFDDASQGERRAALNEILQTRDRVTAAIALADPTVSEVLVVTDGSAIPANK